MMRWALVSVALLGLYATHLSAQPVTTSATIYLKASDVMRGQVFSLTHATLWRFYAGDDTTGAWAQSAFDDSSWELVSARFYRDSLGIDTHRPPRSWKGYGWFRMTMILDSSLHQVPLMMRIRHFGASEVYCNGTCIFRSGTFSTQPSREQPTNEENLSFMISPQFQHSTTVVLAVRYSNLNAEQRYQIYRFISTGFVDWLGFNVDIQTKEAATQEEILRLRASTITNALQCFLAGILFILAVIHSLLYYLNVRKEGSGNLYVLFLWGMTLHSFLALLSVSGLDFTGRTVTSGSVIDWIVGIFFFFSCFVY
jgi:hypothetical protein